MKFSQISLLATAFIWCSQVLSQQVIINDTLNVQQLIENHLIKGCVETSNIASPINGSVNGFSSFGYFEKGDSSFPFENGIILSTGKASSGGNKLKEKTLHEGNEDWKNDADLEVALGISNTLNATAIEFDFSSISNQIQFNYILASEEYYGNYPCDTSDGFAFLIKEAGTNDPYLNIAVLPGTSTPVNINNIHNGINDQCGPSNPEYFEGYLKDTNYYGRTKVMSAAATILPNVVYHIKLVIADYKDENYDSAVFIEGNSFNAYVHLGDDITTCADQVTINGDINNPSAIYSWFINDTLIEGETLSTLTVQKSGTYTVKIDIPIATSFCTIEDTINIVLSTTQTAAPISDFEVCDDESPNGIAFFDLSIKTPDVLKSVPKSTYKVSYHWTHDEASENTNKITTPIQNSLNQPTTIYVRIQDTVNGCMAFSSFNLVVHPLPIFTKPSDLFGCADDLYNGLTSIDLTVKNDEITNGDAQLKVSYYHSIEDAKTGENSISSPYNNKSRNEQLFVRVENPLTGCAVNTTLLIRILDKPVINTNAHYIDACDPDHNGFAEFDLTSSIPEVLVGINGVSTSFHETYEDALSGSNIIVNPNNYTNTKQNVQTVFIRVTDDLSGCASVTSIRINTNLLLTGTKIKDFSICDVKEGESPQFDLNSMEQTIVNNLPNVSVNFYETLEDRTANKPLNKAIPYKPSLFPTTLYLTLQSGVCSDVSEIKLLLDPVIDFPSIGSVTYCDTDQDLLTVIDLGSFSNAITHGKPGYSVRYFATESDAIKNTNRLPNFYKNLKPTQIIYTRTISNATGCADVKSFEITILPAPETNPAEDILICDTDQDGFSVVNLNEKINEIVSDTSNRTITFHTSHKNADSGTNAITNPSRYNAKTEMIFARVQSSTPGACHAVERIKIIVNTLPIIPTISSYNFCENGSEGYGSFIFKSKDAEILNGQKGKSVSYYLNPIDADNGLNAIDKTKAFKNTSTTQNIYVRVENITDRTCYSTGTFYIKVGTNPKFNVPRDWFVCDDISNDGRAVFDLSYIVSEISEGINEQLNITFYTSQANAARGYNPIPLEYKNIRDPQLIYARIDNGSICAPITTFNIGLTRAPEANPSKPLQMCSPDSGEKIIFDLTLAEFDILDVRQYNLDIQYYANAEDSESQSNVIKTPKTYTNISNPQTVFVRVTDINSHCYLSIPIDLIVNLPPKFNAIDNVTICANSAKYFDLKEINDQLINDASNIEISYYKSQADAIKGDNPINTDYTYKTSADILYVRMEDNTTRCFAIHNLKLNINPLPIAHALPDLDHCDDDFDGLYIFNLSQQTAKVLNGQDATKFSVSYHENSDDVHTGENALRSLYAATDMQTIYVRISNNATSCYNSTRFKTYVHRRPVLNIPDQVICVIDGSIVVSANTFNINDTYIWSTNATTPEIEIDMAELGTYWVQVTTIFGCETTQSFDVMASESATINFTEQIDFSDPNNITVTISGIGNYLYVLNDNKPQESNIFEHVPIGPNLITIIDLNGCAEVTKAIIILDTPKFMTPNDDGYFDTWHITGVETLPGTVIYIYDRYGKQLAYLTATSNGWDGNYNGQKMPSSDYWFVADVKKDGVSFQLKGHFALKR